MGKRRFRMKFLHFINIMKMAVFESHFIEKVYDPPYMTTWLGNVKRSRATKSMG